jgi:alkyldihydroxyacetonephosphate synthase
MPTMKWWGWGHEGVEFSHEDKPALAPFIADKIGVDVRAKGAAPRRFDELPIAEPILPDDLRVDLEQAAGARFVSRDPLDRVVHGRGKSLRDLILQRSGDLPRLPDVVVRPGDEE